MTYAKGAAILCNKPQFWQFIELQEPGVQVRHPNDARDWLYATLEIDSRKRLDTDPAAQQKWIATVREFNDYLRTGYQRIPKITAYRNADYLALAKLCPCARCGKYQGTGKVVGAHVMGELATLVQKGTAQKPCDFAVAFLCHNCHGVMDSYATTTDPKLYTLEWAMYILRTFEWAMRHGYLQVTNPHQQPRVGAQSLREQEQP